VVAGAAAADGLAAAVAGEDAVGARAAVQRVGAGAADDRVAAAVAVQAVTGAAAVDAVGAAPAVEVVSRFGTMFFSDPAAAFANLAAALRPEARLVLLVWQRREDNEWALEIDAALGDARQPPPPGADPFSLGDPAATAHLLEGAGFAGIRFADVHDPVLYGHDVDAALAFVRGFQDTTAALASLSDREATQTLERLREMLTAHYSNDRGVVLDSRSWLITARRRRYGV
jgi:SAM-dependent methyltransferase